MLRSDQAVCRLYHLQKELKEIAKDTASGVTVELTGTSLRKMIGCLQGGCALHGFACSLPNTMLKQPGNVVALHRPEGHAV